MIKHIIVFSSFLMVLCAQYQYHVVLVNENDIIRDTTGKNYTLQCEQRLQDTSKPAPNLTWTFEGGAPLTNDDKYSIISEKNESAAYTFSTLVIKNGQLSDNGDYKCQGIGGSASAQLELSLDATVSIENIEGGFSLAEGTTFECLVDGKNNASVEWKKDGIPLTTGKNDINKDGKDDLEVGSENVVTLLHGDSTVAGVYHCTALLGTTTKSVAQVVAGELLIILPQSIKVSEGEEGDMECRARSYPVPTITWRKNDKQIEPDNKYMIKTDKRPTYPDEAISILTIRNVTMEDGRPTNYTCIATNGLNTVEQMIILRIRDRLAALWPFIGIVSEVALLIIIILIHEACTKGEDIGEVEDDEEDHLLQKNRTITRDGEQTRMRGTNN